MKDCLFCKIVRGEISSHKIYEDKNHIAILDIFPSVEGQTLVIPKKHISSYVFDMDSIEYAELMDASKKVAKLIDKRLGAIRTCMVMEGMEVDHAHIKLYPIYKVGKSIASETIDLSVYPGYLSTLHGEKASEDKLRRIANMF